MKILGIETSCDETSASVVEDGRKLLSLVTASSTDLHAEFGGVVPEIASRSHVEYINPVINRALAQAGCPISEIDAVAVTVEPGLSGSLLVGKVTAKTLTSVHKKPLIEVNHVLSHPFAAFITESSAGKIIPAVSPPRFPMLALIVSGGHTQLTFYKSPGDFETIGRTTDDAAGEAYDKVAKILGLPYPGGPAIEKLAAEGDAQKYKLPTPKTLGIYDFSFSGLKTAVLRLAQTEIGKDYNFPSYKLSGALSATQKANIAAGFHATAVKYLVDKTYLAYQRYAPASLVVAGGVSASPELRRAMAARLPTPPRFPDPVLCTDNGAMIAVCGYFQINNRNRF